MMAKSKFHNNKYFCETRKKYMWWDMKTEKRPIHFLTTAQDLSPSFTQLQVIGEPRAHKSMHPNWIFMEPTVVLCLSAVPFGHLSAWIYLSMSTHANYVIHPLIYIVQGRLMVPTCIA